MYLLAAGGFAGLYDMVSHTVPFGSGYEMVALAENLARNGSYANPFSVLATGPSAANPPLYPVFLALLFKILGSTTLVAFAATLATIFANAFTAMLLPRLSGVFFGDRRPGIVAAVFWILAVPLWPCWDVGFTVLALVLFCLKTESDARKSGVIFSGAVAGLLAAALFLMNPSTILIFLPWIVWEAYRGRLAPKKTAGYCTLILCTVMAAGISWGVRNHARLGRFVIRTNLGVTLYSSNNDCANPSLEGSEATNCYQARNPNTSVEEAEMVRALGEIQYDRMRVHEAKVWIESHPGRFMRITLARIGYFWFPTPDDSLFRSAVVWVATFLSIPGLFLMIRRRMGVAAFVSAVFLIYPLMYYIVVSDIRYRLPILWLSLLPCGWFLVSLWDRRFGTKAE